MNTALPRLIALCSLIALSQAASAQSAPTPTSNAAPAPQARMLERLKLADTDKDGSLSRSEADKSLPRLASRFDTLDTNKDGKLSTEELQAARQYGREGRRGREGMRYASHRQPMGGPGGVVTREELLARHQLMLQAFDSADSNKDGKLSLEEKQSWHDKRRARMMPPPAPAR